MNEFFLYKIFFLLLFFQINSEEQKKFKILVFGGTGWIGKIVAKEIKNRGHIVFLAKSRLQNRESIEKELIKIMPDRVINAAGITGKPNVNWCEDHREKTIRANVLGAINLVDICYLHGVHITNFTTGCIYSYDEEHTRENKKGFTEEDDPNFSGSFYSKTKILAEKIILFYPNVLNLRCKMPIDDTLNIQGFVGKIIRYKKVINEPNSMCILHDLIPPAIQMCLEKDVGNYNLVNPGTLSHNEVLDLYKEYIDPSFTYQNFSVEELNALIKIPRSNCCLSSEKLLQRFPLIPDVKDSIKEVFKRISKNLFLLGEV